MLVKAKDVKQFLQYDKDENDGLIDTLISRIEADFKEWIGGATFDADNTGYAEVTEYYDGDGTSSLKLLKAPIRSITNIYVDPQRVFGAGTIVPASEIIDVDFVAGIVQLYNSLFLPGKGIIKVVYRQGWKATDAPADFKQIIVNEVCADLLEGIGGVNVVEANDFIYRPAKLRKRAADLKAKYRNY